MISGLDIRLPLQSRAKVADQREAAIKCELCGKLAFVRFVWGSTSEQKNQGISDALLEHRRVACTASEANVKRVYRIWYPGYAPEMSSDALIVREVK